MARIAQPQQFVGRREQLDLLERCHKQTAAGSGCVVAIGGEAGSGKSRLSLEFCRGIAPDGTTCVMGQSLEYVQSPFAPFRAALSVLAADEPGALKSFESSPATDKLDLFNAVAEILHKLGERRPIVVVIEDLHWADSASLELLQHLAARVGAMRVLLIATFRSEDLKRNHPLRSILAKLGRLQAFYRTDLAPLPATEMHELVFNAAGDRVEFSGEALGTICSHAEGNPLFAEELLKTVIESGQLSPDHLPGTLREAVLDRCAVLDETERAVLTHAAVLGRRFKPEFLAEIVSTPLAQVLKAMKRAVDLALIVEETNGEVTFAFRHELTRNAVYSELLMTEASLLHAKIAAALEVSAVKPQEAELAFHWWQAHQPERAAAHYERAGDAALAVHAYQDALIAYDRALQFGKHTGAEQAALNLKLASALHQCGRHDRAIDAVERALHYYESTSERENAASTCLRLAWMRGGYGDGEAALQLTQHALELIEHNPASPAYFDAHVQMMRLYKDRWEPGSFQEHMALAQAATGTRSAATQVMFLGLQATLAIDLGNPSEARDRADEAIALALSSGDVTAALRSHADLAMNLSEAGEVQRADAAFVKTFDFMRAKGITGLTATWIVSELARSKMHRGQLNEARELVLEALAADIALPIFRLLVARTGIPLGLLLEDDSLVRRCAQKDLVQFALRSSHVAALGAAAAFAECHVARGRPSEAGDVLTTLLAGLDRIKAQPGVGDVDALAIAVARFGSADDIGRARDYLARAAGASQVRSTPAVLELFDAYAAKRTGEGAAATAKANSAAQAFHEIGWPLYEAQALELLGKPAAALGIYKRVGAVREVKRLDPIVNPVNRRGRSKGEMTTREREICDLLVQGKTNKAIAENLVVSERTVESHVSSILMKLGVSSRAELIARLKA